MADETFQHGNGLSNGSVAGEVDGMVAMLVELARSFPENVTDGLFNPVFDLDFLRV